MLNKKEYSRLVKIEEYHLSSVLDDLQNLIIKHGLSESLDNFEKIINRYKNKTKKRDIFPVLIEYIFLKMKSENKISDYIFITSNPSANKFTKNVNTIYTNTLIDSSCANLAIYSVYNDKIYKCFLLLAKDGLKEHINKLHKWKLLLEIATSDCSVRDKYNIRYDNKVMPLVGFATVNFYNEINNPQHRGMFQFFDSAFIGKPIESSFISNLSKLPEFVRSNLL